MDEKQKQDNETYYDQEVAPKLAEIAKELKSRGMSLVALVGNSDDTYSSVMSDISKDNPTLRLGVYTAKSQGNVDGLFMSIERDAQRNGHNSIYLKMLEHYRKLTDNKS